MGVIAKAGPKNVDGKRKRKEKDPNAPKRSISAYFFFLQEERKKNDRAGIKIKKVAQWSKDMGEKWRNMTDTDKTPFAKQATTDRARYDEQMADYSGKETKDANKPKRPMSSYFIFLGDFRTDNKARITDNKDLLRAAGHAWKDLDDSEKKPYEVRAAGEKTKYEAAMKEYNKKGAAAPAKKQKVAAAAANNVASDDDDEEEEDEEEEEESEEEDDE